jgi:AraC-like DNA-binding protein
MPDALSVPSGPARPDGAYQENAPPASLAQHVECFWSRAASGNAADGRRSHRVMPDGCVDIVLAFDADGGAPKRAMAVGTMTRPLVFHDSTSTRYLGVRFRPGVAGVLFGMPASELTDERPALGEVWPHSDALTDTLTLGADTGSCIRVLSAEIARRLLAAPSAPPRTVIAATMRIAAARGRLPIRELAKELGVTRQHLARSFAQHVGLSPKMLARIVRARGVVDRAREATHVDWSSVALDAGYYDQSHLIADVKELTGLPPGAWVGARA